MSSSIFGESAEFFRIIGAAVTVFVAFKVGLGVIRFIVKHFLGRAIGLPINLKNAGSWAVVTGATDGIGKAYAEQLAKRGLNVVLISRTLAKLEDMAQDVESNFKVQTKVIAADMSQEDIYDDIKVKLDGLDIAVLVNNVGCSYDFPEFFGEVDEPNFITKMIHMNCTSVAMMTKIVLPGMVGKRKGYVINIGSSAGSNPTPLLALYSGTKAYVELFTKSLHHEYKGKGITFQYVKPYFVCSKLSKFRKPNMFIPTPTTFVKNALNLVGMEHNTTGYWAHELQDAVLKHVPVFMTMNMMKGARAKALKKKAAKTE